MRQYEEWVPKIYFLKRRFIHELNGAIYVELRQKLEQLVSEGKAVDATNFNYSDTEKYKGNPTYIKYLC
ncbi:hypothetical protein [Listeria fleischmannii]|uniref:Uncharacterized protein n=1 Tax=Listeria fleischmannii FSL S10-1203 TaxID=1265822 RepID=W7D893_9LIST|nr:hypothetical protein [Listeria fleischmannii]EUJ48674.1 hypothetical protein MCOL2_17052 [Listeria fleischmannii FSL S10-1203]